MLITRTYFVVDVEADASSPAIGSMVCFGAIAVTVDLTKTFYGQTAPITNLFSETALAISGFSRVEHCTFSDPQITMQNFYDWILKTTVGRPIFISDNLAFDWQWINFYFDKFIGKNPFGWSGRRIGDIYCGYKQNLNLNAEWKKKYRKTQHTHHPVDDAKGNAEALLALSQELKIKNIL